MDLDGAGVEAWKSPPQGLALKAWSCSWWGICCRRPCLRCVAEWAAPPELNSCAADAAVILGDLIVPVIGDLVVAFIGYLVVAVIGDLIVIKIGGHCVELGLHCCGFGVLKTSLANAC